MADWKSSRGYFAVCSVTVPGGQGHQLAQVVVGADQVADEVDLGGDDVDRRDVDVLAIADDVVVAGPAEHPHALRGRAALADEVDDRLRTVAAGELEDLLELGAVGDDAVVGADGHRELDASGLRSTTMSSAGMRAFST